MNKVQNKDTRYFIDIDTKTMKVIKIDFGQRQKLINESLAKPSYHRIYLTKGQYNKFIEKCILNCE